LEPDHVESLYNLGMVYSDRMQLSEARQLLSRAVELDPGYANGEALRGVMLCTLTPRSAPKPLG
jgi:Tfp pilus assembly protein PilF